MRVLVLALLLSSARILVAADTIVLLPFDDYSGSKDGLREVMAGVSALITDKGWNVVSGKEVESLLENERVRYFDALDARARAALVEKTGATAIVSGTLYTFADKKNPSVALSARMMRVDGTVAWGNVTGLSASDDERLFGLGLKTTADDVAKDAVADLLRRFPSPKEKDALHGRQSRPWFHRGPEAFLSTDVDAAISRRVCILPFENHSPVSEASRLMSDVLALRLAAADGFEVVDAETLRAAALKARVGTFRFVGSDELRRLAAAVGTPLFISGTIFTYVDPNGSGSRSPEVDIALTLIDVEQGRVLWAAEHTRKGTDYTGFLMQGTVTSGVALVDRVLAEVIATGTKARKQNAKSTNDTRAARLRDTAQQQHAAR